MPPTAAGYRLAFYNEAGKCFGITGMWKPDKEGSQAVLQAKTGGKYVEDAVRELVRVVRAGESVRFAIFKVDPKRDAAPNTATQRDDGPPAASADGLDMGPPTGNAAPESQPNPAPEAAPGREVTNDDIPF